MFRAADGGDEDRSQNRHLAAFMELFVHGRNNKNDVPALTGESGSLICYIPTLNF